MVFHYYYVGLCFVFLAKHCAFDIKQCFPSVQDVLSDTWVNPHEYSQLIKLAKCSDILTHEVNSQHFIIQIYDLRSNGQIYVTGLCNCKNEKFVN